MSRALTSSSRRIPLGLTLMSLAIGQAWAQAGAPVPAADAASAAAPSPSPVSAGNELQSVTVVGRALAAKKAIAEKRALRVISDGISSDEVGAIPDFGLGEALERVSGVSMIVNNGRGESQFMTVRGLNPDYNGVTIDGVALPGTETTRRIVSLDVIPSSLAEHVSIYKSFTPEMDGNAVGGLTDLRTRSALDKVGQHTTIRGDLAEWTSHPRLRGRNPSGEFEATTSNTFGEHDQFGALLSAGYFRRDSSSLNTAIDSYSYLPKTGAQTIGNKLNPASTDVSQAVAFPDRLRWLSYDNVRERTSLFGKLDYDNGETFKAHLTGGLFQHRNNENRYASYLQNNTTPSTAIVANPGAGSSSSGQAQADFAHFEQTRQLRYVEGSAEYKPWAAGVLDFTLNRARGSYKQDALIYTFAQANSPGLAYDYTQGAGEVPVLVPRNPAQLADPTRYVLSGTNGVQPETSSTEQDTIKLNLAHNLDETARGWGFKAGLQHRLARKAYDYNETLFTSAPGTTTTLAQAGVSPTVYVPYTSPTGRPMVLLDPDAITGFVAANPNRFTPSTATNLSNSTQRDFNVKERVEAAYAMTAYQTEALTATLGARVEQTRTEIDTYTPSPANQLAVFAPVHLSSSRTDVLPSVNLSWDALPTLRLRAAAGQSLARALYSQLAQNSNSVAGTNITTTIANPNLVPRKSLNLDLSLEWYVSQNQSLTLGLFDKRISNEIANTTSTNSLVVGGQTFTQTVTQASNIGTAKVSGIELGYTNVKFTGMPAPLSDFGVTGNLTLMRQDAASVRMGDGSYRQLPGLQESPKAIANIALLWGRGAWAGQVAYKRTGRTLLTASSTSAAQDVFIDAVGMVDAQIRYQFTPRLTGLLQGKNLTNEPQQRRLTGPNADLLNQEIHNGKSYWVGLAYAY